MLVENVLEMLRTIGGYSEEEAEGYRAIAEVNSALVDENAVDEAGYNAVAYYLAAKTNYELCLMRQSDGVTSFTAGDIKLTQSQGVDSARELCLTARQNALPYLSDNGFAFREV